MCFCLIAELSKVFNVFRLIPELVKNSNVYCV